MRCSVKGCRRNSRSDRVSFYRFPTDVSARKKWLQFCDNDSLDLTVNSRICADHFESQAYRTNQHGASKRLKNSIPTIKVCADPTAEPALDSAHRSTPLYSSPAVYDHTYADFAEQDDSQEVYFGDEEGACNDTENETDHLDDSPGSSKKQCSEQCSIKSPKKCCARNERLLHMWRRRAQHWKSEFLKLNKQFEVPQKLKGIFNSDQIDVALGRVKKVKKWSEATILRGLKTKFACGKGYEYLRQQNQPYPSPRTLLEHVQGIPFDTGSYCISGSCGLRNMGNP
nr:uncharacterized protein LOC115265180 [Aedes albopictus]